MCHIINQPVYYTLVNKTNLLQSFYKRDIYKILNYYKGRNLKKNLADDTTAHILQNFHVCFHIRLD